LENKDSYDSNHAIIFREKIADLNEVLEDIIGFYKEKEMYDNFMRGYKLAKIYLERTQDYDRYEEWFKILAPIHVGNILAEIPENPIWDDIGDLVDKTLTIQIEMLEDWKKNHYESFTANGGESLLARCMEY
jgi:hypothetical protein